MESTRAWFRFRWMIAPERLIVTGQPLVLRLRAQPETVGRLLPPGEVEPDAVAEATSKLELSEQDRAAFADIAARRLPTGSDVTKDTAGNVDRWLNGDIDVLVQPVLPTGLQVMVQDQREDLQAQARRVTELARWVTNAPGSHNPFRRGVLEFSLDESRWHLAPKRPPGAPTGLRVHQGVQLDRIDSQVVSELAVAGRSEPVGHSLIREALDMVTRAPRSSVVIAAAAVETAVKEAIQSLAPGSAYLVDEMPSPPVPKLLKDYLPTLPSPTPLGRTALPAPKQIRASLQWCIETRNTIVHRRQPQHWFPELPRRLADLQDLIWLLDAYCGNDWALGHISRETQALRDGASPAAK